MFEYESVDQGEQAMPVLDRSMEFKKKLAEVQQLKQEEFWTKPLEGNNIFLAITLQRKHRCSQKTDSGSGNGIWYAG